MTRKKKFLTSLAILFAIGTPFALGFLTGYSARPSVYEITSLSNKDSAIETITDFSPYWRAWQILDSKYIFSATTTDQEKVWGSIQGLAASYGDPYTGFFPPSDAKIFEEDVKGSFEGVGMEIGSRQGILTVISPLKGSPSEKAGIKSGDKIYKIDNTISAEMIPDEAVKLIRGKGGTTVKLTLVRENVKEPLEISIVRAPIEVPTIETEKRQDGIFVIRLFSFTEVSPNLFRNALREFIASGDDKLLLDIRGNPGGYLDAAVDMASWFLPQGAVVVSEDYGEKGQGPVHRSRGYDVFNKNLKFVILVDGGSASASEILAGALSEHGVAKLVGSKTFGKGSVQEMVPVTEDTFLKVTIARWMTPKGNSISERGIEPEYKVEVTEEDVSKSIDAQLNKAVSVLNTWK